MYQPWLSLFDLTCIAWWPAGFCDQHFSLFNLVNMLICRVHKLCCVHQLNVRHAVWLSHSGMSEGCCFQLFGNCVDFCNSMSPLLIHASSNLEMYRNGNIVLTIKAYRCRGTQHNILCMPMGMQCKAAAPLTSHTAACSRCGVPAERIRVSRQPCCITPTTVLRT